MYHNSDYMSGRLQNGGNKVPIDALHMMTTLDIRPSIAMDHLGTARQLRIAIKSGLCGTVLSAGGWIFEAMRETMGLQIYVGLDSDRSLVIEVKWVDEERPDEQIADIRFSVASTLGLLENVRSPRNVDPDFCRAIDQKPCYWNPTGSTTIRTASVPKGTNFKKWAKNFPTEIGAWSPECAEQAQRMIDNHSTVRLVADCTQGGHTIHSAHLIADGEIEYADRETD